MEILGLVLLAVVYIGGFVLVIRVLMAILSISENLRRIADKLDPPS
jgi:hypothetical protein